MPCPTSCLTRGLAILLLLAASAPLAPSQVKAAAGGAASALAQEPAPPKCCFTNPGHSGICEVQPAKDESCRQILDYLNDPLSQGKGYCGNTTIRGGWQSADCELKN